jgi:hypothetical protein
LDDAEFLKKFHDCSLSELRHADHLRLAFLVLRNHEFEAARNFISDGLKRYAASKGTANGYHETITCFWLALVKHCLKRSDIPDFEQFLAAYPLLHDKHLMLKH